MLISAGKLFRTPALSAFLIIIPVIGILLWIFIVSMWYVKNQSDIHLYFRGYLYRENDISEQVINEFK